MIQPSTNLFHSGTSGLALPVSKPQFPAEYRDKSRLEYYASLFNSLEVNSIFYRLPQRSTLVRWSECVPDEFLFTFKVPKMVTHARNLEFALSDVEDFFEVVSGVGPKKGCLLAQFPPSVRIDKMENVKILLESLCTGGDDRQGWNIALEFRHDSWYRGEVYEMATNFGAAVVIHDMADSATPADCPPGRFVYLRFHGPRQKYGGDYDDGHLRRYAAKIKDWTDEGKHVYAYFNNTVGAAFDNLRALNAFVLE